MFTNTVQWILSQQATQNVQVLLVPGDLVDDPNVYVGYYPLLTNQYQLLRNVGISVVVIPGNHDLYVEGGIANGWSGTNYEIGAAWRNADPHFTAGMNATASGGTTNSSGNYLYTYVLNGVKVAVLALEWHPSDAILNWADSVVTDYPDYSIILETHGFLSNVPALSEESRAVEIWNHASCWPNLVQVVCGHWGADGQTLDNTWSWWPASGAAGNLVNGFMFDLQNIEPQVNFVRCYQWWPSIGQIHMRTYETVTNAWLTNNHGELWFPMKWALAPALGGGQPCCPLPQP